MDTLLIVLAWAFVILMGIIGAYVIVSDDLI